MKKTRFKKRPEKGEIVKVYYPKDYDETQIIYGKIQKIIFEYYLNTNNKLQNREIAVLTPLMQTPKFTQIDYFFDNYKIKFI